VLNQAFLDGADDIWTRAEQLELSDAARSRVRVARLPVWYVKLSRNLVTGSNANAWSKTFSK
jgi:hypothetical protein